MAQLAIQCLIVSATVASSIRTRVIELLLFSRSGNWGTFSRYLL